MDFPGYTHPDYTNLVSTGIYRTTPIFVYFLKNGYRPLEFYRRKEKCFCDLCRSTYLIWEKMEPYVDKGIPAQYGAHICVFDMDKVLRIARDHDKYLTYRYPREVSDKENCYFYLGLYSNIYLAKLPEDLKKVCVEYRDSNPLIDEYSLAGYLLYGHRRYKTGLMEQEHQLFIDSDLDSETDDSD